MAHRHPSKLNAEHVAHPGARRLLKAELANCAECRAQGDADALGDSAVLDSLLHGFVLKRAEQWRNRHSRYPVTLYDLAPPDELRFLDIATREVVRLCVVEGRAGDRVETAGALAELANLTDEERARVLGDLVDGILEDEG
ncbi:hypothetical protein LG943_04080 [Streptomonospora sp. S1-112]|uniref:Uncharacterized protein n=1 Tax=Streptomonospora mangrovi TaxID=2883123 RepID=A0A9X3NH32_9ACTN|nr:hypothetical protein [Streptomonospora mangrovi]MDA0563512.1 hypothetical protein [Streptomonospora mangrovi]